MEAIQADKRKWLVLLTTALATTLTYWTSGALMVALPSIAEEFCISAGNASSVTMIYYLALGALTLPFGRLGDSIGHHKVFLCGVIFGSLLTLLTPLLATSLAMVILLRSLTGIALSMCLSVTQAILVTVFPDTERGKVIGINSMLVAGMGMVGQLMGGIISQYLDWRTVFFIPVPLGIVCAILGFRVLKGFQGSRMSIDVPGTVLIVLFLTALTLLLKNVALFAGFDNRILFGCIAFVSLVLLLLVERRAAHPLIPLKLLCNRNVSVGYVLMAGAYMVSGMITNALPFYLQDGLGTSSSVSGIVSLMYPLAMVLLATRFGALSDKRGTRGVVICGLAIQSISVLFYALCGTSTPIYTVAAVMSVFGISSAMFYSPNASGIISNVPSENVGMVSGMNSAVRSVSNSIGLNLFSILIATRTSIYEARGLAIGETFCLAQHDMAMLGAAILAALFVLGLTLLPGKKAIAPSIERRKL